jgi:hypothetical protein
LKELQVPGTRLKAPADAEDFHESKDYRLRNRDAPHGSLPGKITGNRRQIVVPRGCWNMPGVAIASVRAS